MKNGKDTGGPQLIGYARVSTEDQVLDLQMDALNAIGCLQIFSEKVSGAAKNRPELDMAIKALRPGDTLVVWRLDRFARSGVQLYARLEQVYAQGAAFKSLQENFDFSTTTGKFILGILGLVAELERSMTIERTKAVIPLDPDNTDYQQFLKDWEAGAEVLNPDGTPAPYVAPETP